MEAKKQSELAKKYWEGKSTLAEEKALLEPVTEDINNAFFFYVCF